MSVAAKFTLTLTALLDYIHLLYIFHLYDKLWHDWYSETRWTSRT